MRQMFYPLPTIDAQYKIRMHGFMKITLDINNTLLADAKALATQQQTTLTRLIEEGLQLRLNSSRVAPETKKHKFPVYKGRGGLVAGLNQLSNKALLDAADNA